MFQAIVRERGDLEAQRERERSAARGGQEIRTLLATVDRRDYAVLVAREPVGDLTPQRKATLEYLGVEHEPEDYQDLRWHIQVRSTQDHAPPRMPALIAVAHEVRPGVTFARGVLPLSWGAREVAWQHLWEIHDETLVAFWKAVGHG